MEPAQIMITVKTLPFGCKHLDMQWKGPTTGQVMVDRSLLPELMKHAPWSLLAVKEEKWFGRDVVWVARTDGLHFLNARLMTCVEAFRRWRTLVKSRLIMTLMVWDLADVPEGEQPDWNHVELSQK